MSFKVQTLLAAAANLLSRYPKLARSVKGEPPVSTMARGLGDDGGNIVLETGHASKGPVTNGFAGAANLGAVASNSGTVTVLEGSVLGCLHVTKLTLNNMPLTLTDASAGGGVKIYDFPEGTINILGAAGSVALTTTSTLASTLNAGVTYNWGVGTTVQANGTLATTEQDILPTTNGTASATINVAGAASNGARVATNAAFDGTGTAKDAYFNVGLATNTDIDGDATVTVSGTVEIFWLHLGDK